MTEHASLRSYITHDINDHTEHTDQIFNTADDAFAERRSRYLHDEWKRKKHLKSQ